MDGCPAADGRLPFAAVTRRGWVLVLLVFVLVGALATVTVTVVPAVLFGALDEDARQCESREAAAAGQLHTDRGRVADELRPLGGGVLDVQWMRKRLGACGISPGTIETYTVGVVHLDPAHRLDPGLRWSDGSPDTCGFGTVPLPSWDSPAVACQRSADLDSQFHSSDTYHHGTAAYAVDVHGGVVLFCSWLG